MLELARSRPATLGGGRLVCIDGPAGSGKTTLAGRVAALADAAVVHLDDLYDGWDGLPRVGEQLATLLLPLARGEAGRYRRHDWDTGGWAETVVVAPAPLLVLEGVGAGSAAYAALATVLVWVEAPPALRLARGLGRDGHDAEPHWRRWTVAEAAHFAADRTRERADLLVDGTGHRAPVRLG
ncbi:4-amino-4-deoxy-L-arabinose transferase [Nocardioides sp. zg-579]|uniref:4-amino-4-deoxy-L-arabinose transferase n=1 Tax=Nocardioides marmotae TaxID=2663857 RepID=A0A6I3JGV0_9ACTN|nr:4-amino-4-deoxy-L-arabinose transferase [Nocardioides marmotae]MCR6033701.1 4-amino-4-deoxy-L-arabinose transferase [Gordonia jinghuaiqii]MTB97359.1 4-amino-4-deoxy-L-arabinose transferase [Nocardioides marmotae]QKE01698.1 4-amino-4-deoxy-L-arabinose transferase [Nocardioides marmotae]